MSDFVHPMKFLLQLLNSAIAMQNQPEVIHRRLFSFIPTKLYLWILKYKSHIIIICQKILFFIFFNHLKMQTPLLAPGLYKNRQSPYLACEPYCVQSWFMDWDENSKSLFSHKIYIFFPPPFVKKIISFSSLATCSIWSRDYNMHLYPIIVYLQKVSINHRFPINGLPWWLKW